MERPSHGRRPHGRLRAQRADQHHRRPGQRLHQRNHQEWRNLLLRQTQKNHEPGRRTPLLHPIHAATHRGTSHLRRHPHPTPGRPPQTRRIRPNTRLQGPHPEKHHPLQRLHPGQRLPAIQRPPHPQKHQNLHPRGHELRADQRRSLHRHHHIPRQHHEKKIPHRLRGPKNHPRPRPGCLHRPGTGSLPLLLLHGFGLFRPRQIRLEKRLGRKRKKNNTRLPRQNQHQLQHHPSHPGHGHTPEIRPETPHHHQPAIQHAPQDPRLLRRHRQKDNLTRCPSHLRHLGPLLRRQTPRGQQNAWPQKNLHHGNIRQSPTERRCRRLRPSRKDPHRITHQGTSNRASSFPR